MEKSTKAALAAGAAAILLLGGGAGTIAFWSDAETVAGGVITHGTLSLTPTGIDCGTQPWLHADAGSEAGQPGVGDPVTLVVPGDEIYKECTYEVEATGDHLEATLQGPTSVTWSAAVEGETVPASFVAPVTVDYAFGGTAAPATITDAHDGQILTVGYTVTIPIGTATDTNVNDTQGFAAELEALSVTLTQVDH